MVYRLLDCIFVKNMRTLLAKLMLTFTEMERELRILFVFAQIYISTNAAKEMEAK